jgi:hypothetical protein
MKKLAATLCLAALATGAFAQGTVNFSNPIGQNISTNGTYSGGGIGITANAANGFYYGLFIAPSTVSTIDSSLQGLFTPTWTFTGVLATNTASAGRLAGGTPNVPGWAPASFQSYLVVGWSANLGASWASVAAQLQGATFSTNAFLGTAFTTTGFIGASLSRAGGPGLLPFGEPGGASGTDTFPTLPLFGTASTGTGTPAAPFTLFTATNVPEPTSMALIGLGLAAGLVLRRHK